jgi:hypothetical protein
MPILVTRQGTLRACAPEHNTPPRKVRFKMTNWLKNQPAKQPAVAAETKATLGLKKCGNCPGVPFGAMSAPQTVGTTGNAWTTFYPTTRKSDLKGQVVVATSGAPTATNAEPQEVSTVRHALIDRPSVATATNVGHGPPPFNCTITVVWLTIVDAVIGSILTAPVGWFGDPERRMLGVLSMLWAAVSIFLISVQCCCACAVNKGQLEGNAANWMFSLFHSFVSIDTMMATVEFIPRTVAFDACVARCHSVCQGPANAVVGVFFVDESENSARKIKIRRHYSAAVRRPRCCPSPSALVSFALALVFFALALICGIDHGWVVLTPNASQSAQAKEVLLASFAKEVSLASFENNGTMLGGPIHVLIVHPSTWDEIDHTSIVCQGRCPECQNQGTFLTIDFVIDGAFFCRRCLLL